ncbi:hypothetical protein BH11MYX4_BH11MYX4_03800 [soil metagenome]
MRPSKLSPEVSAAVFRRLRRGVAMRRAAALAGVGWSSVREWVRRGEGKDPRRRACEPFSSFAVAARQAVALAVEGLHDVVLAAAVGRPVASLQVRSAQWMLARRFPEDYGSGRERAAGAAALLEARPSARAKVVYRLADGAAAEASSGPMPGLALDEELLGLNRRLRRTRGPTSR